MPLLVEDRRTPPGNLQVAIINVSGQLKKTFNIEPFNLGPANLPEDPHFQPTRNPALLPFGGTES